MRLLNTSALRLKEFVGSQVPEYVILSHTWGDDEVLFADIENGTANRRKGYEKVLNCCKKAKLDGFEWVWIDTCCIDKSSSAELSEAINSMYRWYENSVVCYAYLVDVKGQLPSHNNDTVFAKSRWFTRGWTLQELVAPRIVEFYDANWVEIGTKSSLRSTIKEITGVNIRVLEGHPPAICCVAQRLSWASERETTRIEDLAYSLMGLFNINMPLLYGEGVNAFKRLQEEILKDSEDYSIFAWRHSPAYVRNYPWVLARSPKWFCRAKTCPTCSHHYQSSWDYRDLVRFPPARNTGAPSRDLPTVTGRRVRLTLPMCTLARNPHINLPSELDGLDRTDCFLCHLGIGYNRTGKKVLLCLILASDWEKPDQFCRRGLMQMPEALIIHFAATTIDLASWNSEPLGPTLYTKSDRAVYNVILDSPFSCLSILDSQSPGRLLSNDESGFTYALNVTGASVTFFFEHSCQKHVSIWNTEEILEVIVDSREARPWCALRVWCQDDFTLSNLLQQAESAAIQALDDSRQDRVKTFGQLADCVLSVSVKRQASQNPPVPRYAMRISCEEVVRFPSHLQHHFASFIHHHRGESQDNSFHEASSFSTV